MKLEGSLDAFSLSDVFQLLSLTKKTGGLHVRREDLQGAVYFRDGLVTSAASDLSTQSLARRIVGLGLVDEPSVRRAVERAAGEPTGVARALVQAGAADPDRVRELAAEQAIDAVFDLLRWPDGDFAFAVDEADPDDVGLELAADYVVTQANERRAVWDEVSRVIPSPDVVLVQPVVVDAEQLQAGLSSGEWALLSLINGTRTVGDLVEISGIGQFGVVATVAHLVGRGLLTRIDVNSADHVLTVRAQQQLLVSLERAPGPDTLSQPVVEAATRGGTQLIAPLIAGPDSSPEQPDPAQIQGVTGPPAAATHAGGAHEPQAVVPPRREPSIPRRGVEHPEPAAAGYATAASPSATPGGHAASPGGSSGGATVGGAALNPQAAPASLIERDPSVNRSLLLRLIAGVRGL